MYKYHMKSRDWESVKQTLLILLVTLREKNSGYDMTNDFGKGVNVGIEWSADVVQSMLDDIQEQGK